jgi:hypothetical protein
MYALNKLKSLRENILQNLSHYPKNTFLFIQSKSSMAHRNTYIASFIIYLTCCQQLGLETSSEKTFIRKEQARGPEDSGQQCL